MSRKPKSGAAEFFEITGLLEMSEEPSPYFVIKGEGRGLSTSRGRVVESTKNELCIREDLRDANNFLFDVPIGTTVKWTECLGLAKGDSMVYSYSIKVLSDRKTTSKRGR